MKTSLKLNNEINIDLEKLIESRMVVLANSGGGKSYAVRRIVEQAVPHIQVIILDPEGEFASLREKFDFILAGKDADVPVEVRSASLLATKLLEINKSAVIDLYELHPSERQRYVKLFCEALINAPKSLYHPVLIILDEAHEYVPEGKPSEATWAVEALASKGRKRGQCLILASQRIAKLSKNASAECNNKLIGRASQDIDMKRAGDELGFSKENFKDLRQLKPGDFFAFGPAISDEVIRLRIGEVKTSHAKVGYTVSKKTPPPSAVIKKVLGELRDLPQEAEKEATTIQELKTENADLKRKNTNLLKNPFQKDVDPKIVETALLDRDKQWKEIIQKWVQHVKMLTNLLSPIKKYYEQPEIFLPISLEISKKVHLSTFGETIVKEIVIDKKGVFKNENKQFGKCARAIYSYLYSRANTMAWCSKTQIAVATGYSQNSGGFNNSLSELSSAGFIRKELNGYHMSGGGMEYVDDIDVSLDKWLSKLGACPRAIFNYLLNPPMPDFKGSVINRSKEEISSATNYSVSSGGFNNSLSELSSLGLIKRLQGGMIRINPEILDL